MHGAWHGAWCWTDNWVPYLTAAGCNVHTIDLPGHDRPGDSARMIGPTFASYVAAVRRELAALGPETVVIGHSMGGLVVQRAIERRSDLARAAVLLTSVPTRGVVPLVARLLRTHPRQMAELVGQMSLWPTVATPALAANFLFRPETPGPIVDAAWRRLQNESLLAFGSMIVRPPRPARVDIPVGVIAARDDALFPVTSQQRLADRYGSSLAIIESCGHDLMLDTAWKDAADVLLQMIDDLTGGVST